MATAKAKSVYTESVSASLVSAYKSAEQYTDQQTVVRQFAEQLGVSDKSVRAHLVRKGVYQKKPATTKSQKLAGSDKEAIITSICEALTGELELTTPESNSLAKLSAATLGKLLKAVS